MGLDAVWLSFSVISEAQATTKLALVSFDLFDGVCVWKQFLVFSFAEVFCVAGFVLDTSACPFMSRMPNIWSSYLLRFVLLL